MSLALDPIRAMIERDFLDDLIRVTEQPGEAVLDRETGKMIPAPGADFWTGNGAVVASGDSRMASLAEADASFDVTEYPYRALIPLGAPELVTDMLLTVTGSRLATGPRDPHIVGRWFRIAEIPPVSTFAVVRVVPLESWEENGT